MKRISVVALVLAGILLMGAPVTAGDTMQIHSAAFQDGQRIPVQHVMPGAGGKNISVPLEWTGAPEGTKSFALSCVDPHPVANNWVHWLVVNIPAGAAGLPAGASGSAMPEGSEELLNSFGKPGYGGPQPPAGTGDHPYVFTLYALSVEKVDIAKNVNLGEFQRALDGKILGKAVITGMYSR